MTVASDASTSFFGEAKAFCWYGINSVSETSVSDSSYTSLGAGKLANSVTPTFSLHSSIVCRSFSKKVSPLATYGNNHGFTFWNLRLFEKALYTGGNDRTNGGKLRLRFSSTEFLDVFDQGNSLRGECRRSLNMQLECLWRTRLFLRAQHFRKARSSYSPLV